MGDFLNDAKELASEVGSWLWGMVQGEFNEEQTTSQIIVDAGISMIPVAGEVTDVRDIVAVIIRMVQHPEKRRDVLEWAMLIVLVAALIPVFGGAIKGVGRLLLKLSQRGDELAEIAKEVIALLNRLGVGNAEKWFSEFSFAKYGKEIFDKFMELSNRICAALETFVNKMNWALATAFINEVHRLVAQIRELQKIAREMWDSAVAYLDELLNRVKAKIKPDGTGASKEAEHSIPVTEATPTRTSELEMKNVGDEAVGGVGREINKGLTPGMCPEEFAILQNRFSGFNDAALRTFCEAPKILKVRRVWRVFGKGESNADLLAQKVGDTKPTGGHFGVGASPQNAKQWREECAVMDFWNSDKHICEISAPDDIFEGAVGKVARQDSIAKDLGRSQRTQNLDGGGQQVWFDQSGAIGELQMAMNRHPDIIAYMNKVKAGQALGETRVRLNIRGHNVDVTLRPTGWNDANFIHGWSNPITPLDFSYGVRNLGYDELKSKTPNTGGQ